MLRLAQTALFFWQSSRFMHVGKQKSWKENAVLDCIYINTLCKQLFQFGINAINPKTLLKA